MISMLIARRWDQPGCANDIVGSALSAAGLAGRQIVVLPPGALLARDEAEAREIAAMVQLRARLRDLVAIVAIDVRPETCLASPFEMTSTVLYRCGAGASTPQPLHPWACLPVPGGRLAVMRPRAAFDQRLRRWVADRRTDLALILSNQHITDRWRPMLDAWDRYVPVLAVGRTVQVGAHRSRSAIHIEPLTAHDGLDAWLLQAEARTDADQESIGRPRASAAGA